MHEPPRLDRQAAETLMLRVRARLQRLRKSATRFPKGRLKAAQDGALADFSRPFGTFVAFFRSLFSRAAHAEKKMGF